MIKMIIIVAIMLLLTKVLNKKKVVHEKLEEHQILLLKFIFLFEKLFPFVESFLSCSCYRCVCCPPLFLIHKCNPRCNRSSFRTPSCRRPPDASIYRPSAMYEIYEKEKRTDASYLFFLYSRLFLFLLSGMDKYGLYD